MEEALASFKKDTMDLFFKKGIVKVDLEKGFLLKGGVVSPMFFDSETLESCSRRDLITSAFILTFVQIQDIDAFIGVVGGGVSWASCFAANRCKPLLRARERPKTYGLYNQIGGELPFDGAKVLVIDDVITSGNAAISVINALRAGKNARRADVIAFCAIFDWDFPSVNQKFAAAKVNKMHLFSFKDVLDYGKENKYFSPEEVEKLEEFYRSQNQI